MVKSVTRSKRLLVETARQTGIRLLEFELVSVMHRLRGASARFIFLKVPELKVDLGRNSFWRKGYGSRRISPGEVPAIRQYIRTQRSRPLRRGG
jgi:hypothetical protein